MPRKWIDKKTAQHFTLVHRQQNDPLIHDEAVPSMVLNPTNVPKAKKLDDLVSELGEEASRIRDNEGEAANHGIYYDDTEYDYMQHMRDLGTGSGGGEVVFVEADASKHKGKGKKKMNLEDSLAQLDLESDQAKKRSLLDEDILPSKNLQHLTYQAQQDIPDSIGGFQPNMDPRLREVLEALEDDAFVDDDEEIFRELAKDGHESDDIDYEEDAGWETDDTIKAKASRSRPVDCDGVVSVPSAHQTTEEAAEAEDGLGWMEDFNKFKQNQKGSSSRKLGAPPSESGLQSSLMTTTTNGGRRKKRKGALTSTSNYSMTSSSLVRTEQLSILDARFDKIEQQYQPDYDDDGDGMGSVSVSAVSAVSSVPGAVRGDLDGMLDEFLSEHSVFNKKYVRKDGWKSGVEQLDEIRRELGPAKVKGTVGVSNKAATAK